mmetsp:Transcript_18892/g.24298  ORF Transcript_18892/g.24298 Transcript_18892/m.24298 type:complete len:431 (+) Transcript_18892:163-1455(+)|eukprot:CAMPEP_0198147728 /NCGR_PEP_ID=MMETSP1443-20131203/37460_1 /TAXON_ID=186043 /ORGANISM="Entomoneis sp., Strain CCMP2396" /LENGTH=430 /DNA_ID=CAMNT_0043812179 /DNA_START=144 /DNA_END=1436 /DNA_ORIENTATION=-
MVFGGPTLEDQASCAFQSPSTMAGKRFGTNRNYPKSLVPKEDWETTASSRRTPSMIQNMADANLFADMGRANTVIPGRTVPNIPEDKKSFGSCVIEPSYFCTGGFVMAPETPESQPIQDIINEQEEDLAAATLGPLRDSSHLIPTSHSEDEGYAGLRDRSEVNLGRVSSNRNMHRNPSQHKYKNGDVLSPSFSIPKRDRSNLESNDWDIPEVEGNDWDIPEEDERCTSHIGNLRSYSLGKGDNLRSYALDEVDEEDDIIDTNMRVESLRPLDRSFQNPLPVEDDLIRHASLLDQYEEVSEVEKTSEGRNVYGNKRYSNFGQGDDDDQSQLTSDDTLYTTNSLLSQMKKYPAKPRPTKIPLEHTDKIQMDQISFQEPAQYLSTTNPDQSASLVSPDKASPSSKSKLTRDQSLKKKRLSVKGLARILSVIRK